MKVTVYLPDKLAAKVKAADMNVSAVCQTALQAELARLEAGAQVGRGMSREVVTVMLPAGIYRLQGPIGLQAWEVVGATETERS